MCKNLEEWEHILNTQINFLKEERARLARYLNLSQGYIKKQKSAACAALVFIECTKPVKRFRVCGIRPGLAPLQATVFRLTRLCAPLRERPQVSCRCS